MLLNRAASGISSKKQNNAQGRLRLCLISLLLLLIVMMAVWFQADERMIQRQQELNAAYRSHLLFTDLDNAVREARSAASVYLREGKPDQRISAQNSLLSACKILGTIQAGLPVKGPASDERHADVVPRTRLYLHTLEQGVQLRDTKKKQKALALLRASDSDYGRLLSLCARLRTEEEPLLTQRSREMQQEAEQQSSRMWIGTSFVSIVLGACVLVFSRDLGGRTRKERELRSANRVLTQLAEQDSLTHLKNRRALEEELHAEWARSRRYRTPLSLLFVDVDKFKEYNDTFGHQAGDEALRKVADLLRQEEALSGCYVARYGGEEFALLLPQTETEEAQQIGERVRASFESVTWQGRPVTASIGAATLTPGLRGSFSDVETLLNEADGALYQAKREGRNRVIHASALFPLSPVPVKTVSR